MCLSKCEMRMVAPSRITLNEFRRACESQSPSSKVFSRMTRVFLNEIEVGFNGLCAVL